MVSPVKTWRRQKKLRQLIGKKGQIVTWTKIFTPTQEFKKSAPYYCVLVKFGAGDQAFGQLVDLDDDKISIGRKVIAVLRKTKTVDQEEVIPYGLKFRLT